MSGNDYIEAGKQAGEKSTEFLTKGYALKGRAIIHKLDRQPPNNIEMFKKVMYDINDASKYYKMAAEASPQNNQMCNACSLSMKCLSEMLDCMLAVTEQEKVQKLKGKIEEWKENLASCDKIYAGNEKGENFIRSLNKMMVCIKNLEECKRFTMWEEEKKFKECKNELIEIANNIEGPLQKIFEESTKQMDHRMDEIISYCGTETRLFSKMDKSHGLESGHPVQQKIDPSNTLKPNKFSTMLKLISEHPIISGIIVTVVGLIIQKRYFS